MVIFDLEDSYARDRGVLGPHPRPIGSVSYLITGQVAAGARQMFVVPLRLITKRNPSGYDLFFGEVVSAGDTVRAGLPDGTYVVRVEGQFYQPAERDDIVVPSAFAPKTPDGLKPAWFFDLSPNYAYPFPNSSKLPRGLGPTLLRGVVRAVDGTGVEGATIQVAGHSNSYKTDASGQWVLVFPDTEPSGNVTVHFDLPDGNARDVVVPLNAGRESSLAPTALRGWAMTVGTGFPGVKIQVTGQPGEAVSGADGSWSYYFDLNQPARAVTVTAVAPNGRRLTQRRIAVQPQSTVVVPSFLF
jgi:hypothetical protein